MKELTILAGVCAVLGLGSLSGAGYALLGGKDVAIERIFAVIVWGLIGMSLLGAAQWIIRMSLKMSSTGDNSTPLLPEPPRPI